ncbi:TonB-dependent receptor [Duganella sp. FT50W]|uniref:TonB-dependent receptor n=1 Tax=Duganella lactea TaxID=2692173 RepID=A0A6L8MTS4_9BURK|nr:TonB-dependent receptor [Duganella lactea]MYM85394.1 TonB-dependent receptor [Duganella lactea]
MSADRNTRNVASAFRQVTGTGLPVVQGEGSSLKHTESLSGTSKFALALDASHKISVAPELLYIRFENEAENVRRGYRGDAQTSRQNSRSPLLSVGLPLEWNWTMGEDSQLSLKWKTGVTHADNDADRWEAATAGLPHQRSLARKIRGLNHFLDADFNTSFAGGHDFSTGVRLARNRLQNDYADFLDGVSDPSQSLLGVSNLARTVRYQWFAQDDWRINKSWALGAGLNGERRLLEIDEGPVRSRPSFNVWSPTMHIAHKIGGNSKRQLRLSLARTFQPPSADQMLLRPVINSLAPCYARHCAINTFDTADSAGNPRLQPERALGLNLSYSHKLAKASEFVVEVCLRARSATRPGQRSPWQACLGLTRPVT